MKKYHYVYKIEHKISKKKYIGARSCNKEPILDLLKYQSSSSDKEFKNELKTNPNMFDFEVLDIFNNRDDAVRLEILLHNVFDVVINKRFYNKAKQTSTGFSTLGVTWSAGEKNGMFGVRRFGEDNPMFGKRGEKNPIFGIPKSDEHRKKLSESSKRDDEYKDKMSDVKKNISEETRLKMSDAQGRKCECFGKVYKSIKDASIDLNIPASTISANLRDGKEGFIYIDKIRTTRCLINNDVYESIRHASITLGIPASTLRRYLNSNDVRFENFNRI